MGVHKTNVPARFDGETLSRIDAECALHKMNRSQYIRESMIKWLRLRMAGTVQLLDAFVQQEQREICAPREHGEQSLQIEFPVASEQPAGQMKPLVRVTPSRGTHGRREIGGISRRSLLDGSVELVACNLLSFSKLQRPKFNSYVRRVA